MPTPQLRITHYELRIKNNIPCAQIWDVETPSPTIYNNKFFSYAIADCRLVQSECVYARKREQGAASRCGTAGANYEL